MTNSFESIADEISKLEPTFDGIISPWGLPVVTSQAIPRDSVLLVNRGLLADVFHLPPKDYSVHARLKRAWRELTEVPR